MEPTILGLFQKHGKEWVKNEKRKQAKKRAFFQKPYPCDRDIYGRKRGDER